MGHGESARVAGSRRSLSQVRAPSIVIQPALPPNVTNIMNARFHYYVIGRHFSFNSRKGVYVAQITNPYTTPLTQQLLPNPCPCSPPPSWLRASRRQRNGAAGTRHPTPPSRMCAPPLLHCHVTVGYSAPCSGCRVSTSTPLPPSILGPTDFPPAGFL